MKWKAKNGRKKWKAILKIYKGGYYEQRINRNLLPSKTWR